MNRSTLLRLSGLAGSPPVRSACSAGCCSLPGIYGWLAPRLGKLGLVGYVLYFVGNLLNAVPHLVLMTFAGHELAEHPEIVSDKDMIIAAPAFETEQVITASGFILGLLLFGIALVRAHGVPRPIGIAAIAGAVLIFVPIRPWRS